MNKYALIVRDTTPPQGRGKVAHAITNALALHEAGHEAKIYFEGEGVDWMRLFREREDGFTKHYGPRFDAAREAGLIAGACNFCTQVRFKVGEHADALGIPMHGANGEHGDLVALLTQGYVILTF